MRISYRNKFSIAEANRRMHAMVRKLAEQYSFTACAWENGVEFSFLGVEARLEVAHSRITLDLRISFPASIIEQKVIVRAENELTKAFSV